jgi:type VI secretion system protein ImpH
MRDPVERLAQLAAQPRAYEFFAALRLIESAYPELSRLGQSERPSGDPVRLGQSASLAFEPGMVTHFEVGAGGRARLEVGFLGLLGANGPMPTHLAEYVRDRIRNAGDMTLSRFLDVFHHRMLSLFYRAWSAAQPVASLDRPDGDRFGVYIGSMFGLGQPALRSRDRVPDPSKLHFAGRLADRRRNAEGLAALLGDYFRVPVQVQQFVGGWMRLAADQRTRLRSGPLAARLGVDTVIGTAVWSVQHKFRLVIGPLDLAQYRSLLPGGAQLGKLVDWVRFYVGDHLDWDLRLVLRRDQVPRMQICGGTRLGLDSWLLGRPAARDAADLLLHPLAHLPGGSA